jgi:carbamoyltransferase
LLHRDLDGFNDVGFGKAYARFTSHIGFEGYLDAGKTMGLSAFVNPPAQLREIDLWKVDKVGTLRSILSNREGVDGVLWFLVANGLFVPPAAFPRAYDEIRYRELASYIQRQLCKWALIKCKALIRRTGIKRICLGGGVALNAILNSAIEAELGVEVFVPPYPSDEGQAVGNAIFCQLEKSSPRRKFRSARVENRVYLGPSYTTREISEALESEANSGNWTVRRPSKIARSVAFLLARGNIVGWYQGRSEFAARALGNRSILGDARVLDNHARINTLKGRELFRPLAPVVLDKFASTVFEDGSSLLFRHMLGITRVREGWLKRIPAAAHVDASARVQVLSEDDNPLMYELLENFLTLTEVPILLNTSFNGAGDPIVETPRDAIRSAQAMQLDALAIGPFLLQRIKHANS